MRILHMSDLHFGIESDTEMSREEIAVRNYYVNDLVKGLGSITKRRPVDYILITGDIVYTASEKAYAEAGRWLTQISRMCGVPMERIYLCPGDRDVNEAAGKERDAYPGSQRQANELLGKAHYGRLTERFQAYCGFCGSQGLGVYELNRKKNYLTGVAVTPDINIMCLNTAWFSESNAHKGNVWTGSMLVELMKRERQYGNGHPTIAIMHHPVSCWNEEEKTDRPGNVNVYHELCRIADMILTGHAQEAEDGYIYRNNVYLCGNGAIYKDHTYHHNFHMYEWDNRKGGTFDCTRTVYSFDGRAWYRKSCQIRIESKRRRETIEKPFRYSFSVLWWTR